MNSQTITINIDAGLSRTHSSLRSVCSQGVYQRGLKSVALSINRDPGNLSRELADNGRHLSVDSLELYIERTGDMSPIHYLVERFLMSRTDEQAAALAQAQRLLQQLQPLLPRI
jgi:hypothetical protein